LQLRNGGKLVNGDPYSNEYIVILKFLDGKVIEMREFVDSDYTKRALSAQAPMQAVRITICAINDKH
jgi:ketosteroid isomerase-like protein